MEQTQQSDMMEQTQQMQQTQQTQQSDMQEQTQQTQQTQQMQQTQQSDMQVNIEIKDTLVKILEEVRSINNKMNEMYIEFKYLQCEKCDVKKKVINEVCCSYECTNGYGQFHSSCDATILLCNSCYETTCDKYEHRYCQKHSHMHNKCL
jgi:chemotaxis protein histidine kinase CheA